MTWEVVERKKFHSALATGPWATSPCISITKTGISLNRETILGLGIDITQFLATEPRNRPMVQVLLDLANQRLAVILVPPGTENAYSLSYPSTSGKKCQRYTLQFSARRVIEKFPTLVSARFRAVLDRMNGRPAVVVSLIPANRVN